MPHQQLSQTRYRANWISQMESSTICNSNCQGSSIDPNHMFIINLRTW